MASRNGYVWDKRPKHKVDIESSIGDRLKLARSGDTSAALPKPVVQTKVAPPRSAGGAVLTPELVAMRDAAKASRENVRAEQARMQQAVAVAQDPDTVRAILSSWLQNTPSFFQSEFNLTNVENALQHMVLAGRAISIGLLNEVHAYLSENNYLEKAVRVRGQSAARVFQAPPEPEPDSVYRGRQVQIYSAPTAEERKALKAVPLRDLARQVRAGYRTEQPPYQPKY